MPLPFLPMKRACFVTVALWLAACGSSDPASPEERLIGVWVVELGSDCVMAYVFGADDDYEQRYACFSSGGESTIDVELYGGGWSATETAITLEPRGGSCSRESAGAFGEAGSMRYQLQDSDQTLRISSASGAVYFVRVEDDGMPSEGGAVLQLGCYDPDTGAFTPRPAQRF